MISASMVKELREISGAGMMDCKKALEESNGDMDKASDWLRENGFLKATKKESRIAAEGLANIYIDGNTAVIIEINSETDFVSKNEEFRAMLDTFGNIILKSKVNSVDEALSLECESGTLNDLLVSKTAKIGEKLSFRRFERVTKKDNEVFGSYLHMGGKIAVLSVLSNTTEDVAKDISMHIAAMKPEYLSERDISGDIIDALKESFKVEALNEGKPANIAEKMIEGKLKKYYKEVCLNLQPFVKSDDIDVKTFVERSGGSIISMIRYAVGEGIEKRNENFAEEVMNQINK